MILINSLAPVLLLIAMVQSASTEIVHKAGDSLKAQKTAEIVVMDFNKCSKIKTISKDDFYKSIFVSTFDLNKSFPESINSRLQIWNCPKGTSCNTARGYVNRPNTLVERNSNWVRLKTADIREYQFDKLELAAKGGLAPIYIPFLHSTDCDLVGGYAYAIKLYPDQDIWNSGSKWNYDYNGWHGWERDISATTRIRDLNVTLLQERMGNSYGINVNNAFKFVKDGASMTTTGLDYTEFSVKSKANPGEDWCETADVKPAQTIGDLIKIAKNIYKYGKLVWDVVPKEASESED